MMERNRFEHTGAGQPDMTGTTEAPFQTGRRRLWNVMVHRVDRSSNTNADRSPVPTASRICVRTFNTAVSVESLA